MKEFMNATVTGKVSTTFKSTLVKPEIITTIENGEQHKIIAMKYIKIFFVLLVDCRICCLFVSVEFSIGELIFVRVQFLLFPSLGKQSIYADFVQISRKPFLDPWQYLRSFHFSLNFVNYLLQMFSSQLMFLLSRIKRKTTEKDNRIT